jgi:NAD(P)-dependent dehydrogenase (short-subunit alcohol dehydrogenase family)
MKILLVGDRGTIGSAVADLLASRGHTVLGASRSHAERPVDLTDAASIDHLYAEVGTVDAVACAGGHVVYGLITEMSYDKYRGSLCDKALGQIELVRRGLAAITPRGSFTLITGVLLDRPIVTGSAAAAANGAVEGFARAAALELAPIRVNVVSPTLLIESVAKNGHLFPGETPVSAALAANAYLRSIETLETGQIYRLHRVP